MTTPEPTPVDITSPTTFDTTYNITISIDPESQPSTTTIGLTSDEETMFPPDEMDLEDLEPNNVRIKQEVPTRKRSK